MPALSPESLQMIDAIARHGSFARAARELGKVPSALTYSVRKIEDELDALLFDRSGHRARLTPAGEELLREGRPLLEAFEALAQRVHRYATGWETELRIAVNGALNCSALLDLVDDFEALGTGTRLRFSYEVLRGNWDALLSGRADITIGADADNAPAEGFQSRAMGALPFVFCMSPHHSLAKAQEPLQTTDIDRHTALVVADTARRLPAGTKGLLSKQHTITLPTIELKIQAMIRGLGCGYLPQPLATAPLAQGLLVARAVEGPPASERLVYAWRGPAEGRAMKWMLKRLQSARLHAALLSPPQASAHVAGAA